MWNVFPYAHMYDDAYENLKGEWDCELVCVIWISNFPTMEIFL